MDKYNEYLIPPNQQVFWKRIAFWLDPFAIGATHWWGLPRQPKFFKILHYVTLIFGPVSFLSQIVYFYLHNSEYTFLYLGNLFTVIMVTGIVLVKLFTAQFEMYRRVISDFMTTIHIYFYEPKDAFVEKTLIQVGKYNRQIAGVIVCLFLLDTLFWVTVPAINNFINGAYNSNSTVRLQSCIYMMMPFDYEHDARNWVVMWIINIYVAGFGCSLLSLSDTIMLCIITHLIGRIKILQHNLEVLADEYDNFSEDEVTKRLHICIRDHVFILRYFKDMQESFGVSVTSYYAFNLIFDSLLVLELKYGDKTARVAYMIMIFLYIGGLLGLSFVMEEVRIQGDLLPNAVYNIPWERMSLKNQKTLLIFLARVQPILVFKAFAGLEAGVRPAFTILKTSLSYYLMLEAKTESEI